MGKFLEFFRDKFEKWKAWSKIKKLVFFTVIALLVSVLIIGLLYATKTEYATLFSNLEAADSNKVVEKLKTDKVPYKIEGNSILVPKENVDELRMSALSEGTVSSGKGFELFDQSTFGITDKEANIKYQRAVQGELERAISSFEEVESAKVLLVIPEETVFSREKETGSASVTLTLKGADTLQPEKVKSIVSLVSGSVKNIPKENVEVMDSKMNLLSEGLYDDSGVALGTPSGTKQHEAEKAFEKRLESELTKDLEAMFGKSKVRTSINADLDFDSKQRTRITYDKDNVVPRSIKEITEKSDSTDGSATGTPGTDTNTGVNYPAGGNGNGRTTIDKRDATTNNEIGQTEEKVVDAPGEIRRLTASVMIDGNLTEAQKASVRNMVAAAIGIDTVNRRDVINIDSMVFDEDSKKAAQEEAEALLKAEEQKNLIRTIALIAVGAVLLIGTIVALIILRRRKRQDALEEEESLAGTGTNLDISDGTSPMAPAEYESVLDENEEDYKMSLEKEIRSYSEKKPDQVVEIIKTWLSEDER